MQKDGKEKSVSPFRIFLGWIFLGVFVASIFLCAGRWDWIAGWNFIGVVTCGQVLNVLYLRKKNPEVLRGRSRIGKGTKPWDKVWLFLFMVFYMAIIYVAAFDFGRSGIFGMPLGCFWAGMGFYVVFLVLMTWAMAENPHFEKTVRIQHDRNHRVIDTGPYRFVRHPGYVCVILGYFFSAPLMLGSWRAFVPAGLSALWMVVRTALEDQTLRRELDGYEEYAQRVKYRLLPCIW